MSINTRAYTFIGNSYQEIVKAFFSAINSYANITMGTVTSTSANCYAYFTVTDSINDQLSYNFCLNAYDSGYTMRAGPAGSGYSGGSMVTYFDINSGSYSKIKSGIAGTNFYYSHCRMFYDENDNFIGSTGLFAENFTSPYWFAIFHKNDGTPIWIKMNANGYNSVYDMSQSPPASNYEGFYVETSMSTNQETPDSVYIELQATEQNSQLNGFIPDVYAIYNNTFMMRTNNITHVKGLLFINTEMGQFLGLRKNTWLKIENVGENTTVIYNG